MFSFGGLWLYTLKLNINLLNVSELRYKCHCGASDPWSLEARVDVRAGLQKHQEKFSRRTAEPVSRSRRTFDRSKEGQGIIFILLMFLT